MRRVLGAQAQVQEKGLVRRDRLLLADHADRLVDDVLGQVIALAVRRLDVVVVQHQFRMPLVGFAFQETVEAVEAALQRPLVVGAGR